MPEQDPSTGELQNAEEVLDVIFPACDEAAGVVEPGEETFDLPAAAGAAQGASILRGCPTAPAMPGDHLDAVSIAEDSIEGLAVVAAIANQPRREVREEARVEGGRDKVGFMRRSAGHVHGERK